MSTFSKFWETEGSVMKEAGCSSEIIASAAFTVGYDLGKCDSFSRIEVLELRETDIIVLSYAGKLTEVAHNRLKESFANATCLKNHKVIVLEEGIKISALRPTANIEDGSDF